jgi:hypothetical protein
LFLIEQGASYLKSMCAANNVPTAVPGQINIYELPSRWEN